MLVLGACFHPARSCRLTPEHEHKSIAYLERDLEAVLAMTVFARLNIAVRTSISSSVLGGFNRTRDDSGTLTSQEGI